MFTPIYLKTYHQNNLLKLKIQKAYEILKSCRLCPRNCNIDRTKGEVGFCKTGDMPVVSSFAPHHGEESPLVGSYGSGTIFFTNCNLGCIFCQNYDISHLGQGETVTLKELAQMMLSLQKRKCHNINFVTPTHQLPFILSALKIAIEEGLKVPLVWNCGGYESIESIKLLEDIIDIFMPDFKYWDTEFAQKYSKAKDYPQMARLAIKEMHRQVSDLAIDSEGVAQRGLLIRHLVLPNNLAGTEEICQWIANELSHSTYINIMDQYRPCYKANSFSEINRTITSKEWQQAIKWAKEAGLTRLDQEIAPRSRFK